LKVAVIGVGNMGSKYVKKLDMLNIDTVLIDKEQERLKNQPEKFKKYTDLDEALKENKIDFAFVATDPISHIPIAKKLLERDINVMVEKPPALNPIHIDEAINLAQRKNLYFSVSEIELKSYTVRNIILNEPIDFIEAYRLNLGRGYINPFFDLAWHDLYILNYLFGSFNIKKIENVNGIIKVKGNTDKQEFTIKVAWEYPYIKREWILQNNNSSIKLNFVNDEIVYNDNSVKSSDKKDKLELMIKEFLNNPSFESAYRALDILKEFERNKIVV